MGLKYSGLLFLLIVILEAINGLALNNASNAKGNSQELQAISISPEKSQKVNGVTTESVKIIIPNTSEIISKSNGSVNAVTTDSSTTTSPITTPIHTSTPTPTLFSTPTPAPAPEKGQWVVRNETSKMTCIIAQMAMQLNITYPGKNEKETYTVVNVPRSANSSGNCTESSQSLIIKWSPNYSLQINFSCNKSEKNFFISGLLLSVNATIFKGAEDEIWNFNNTNSEFTTPLGMSYKCNKMQNVNLESGNAKLKAVLSLKDTQFEAFMNKSKAEFGAVQDCDTFDTPDIVPIAVGCALAILVLVVLVAYLIGRKRSQNQGYLSM